MHYHLLVGRIMFRVSLGLRFFGGGVVIRRIGLGCWIGRLLACCSGIGWRLSGCGGLGRLRGIG